MLIHPVIRPKYIQPAESYENASLHPFDLPMNLDDSGINLREEMVLVCDFLYGHRNSGATFTNYLKDMERFCQWLWRIKRCDMLAFKREDAVEYMEFFINPPFHWISNKGRFQKYKDNGQADERWRPFSARASQAYSPSKLTIRQTESVLRTFYYYLIEERKIDHNPFHALQFHKRHFK